MKILYMVNVSLRYNIIATISESDELVYKIGSSRWLSYDFTKTGAVQS
jgi:hypothetical protein